MSFEEQEINIKVTFLAAKYCSAYVGSIESFYVPFKAGFPSSFLKLGNQ